MNITLSVGIEFEVNFVVVIVCASFHPNGRG
eukprot:COSAG01_NODE_57735_length_310_cov_0.985782_2_plen_30_part_01